MPPIGRTSEIRHRSALVERHWVTVTLPQRANDARRKKAVAEARAAAGPALTAVGLTPAVAEEWHRPGEAGVSWTVVVGEVSADPAERQPFWVWTPRWRHWLATLQATALRERSARMNAVVDGYSSGALSVVD